MTPEMPQSPLPRDPEYWRGLARRIAADAAGTLADYAAAEAWYGLLARRAAWLVAASAAAMAVLWLTLPQRGTASSLRWMEASLVPDEIAGSLIAGERPPSVDVLMAQFAPAWHEEVER